MPVFVSRQKKNFPVVKDSKQETCCYCQHGVSKGGIVLSVKCKVALSDQPLSTLNLDLTD